MKKEHKISYPEHELNNFLLKSSRLKMVFKKGFPKCTLSTPLGLNEVHTVL